YNSTHREVHPGHIAKLKQSEQKPFPRRNTTHITRNGFYDNGCDFILIFIKQLLDRMQIIKAGSKRILSRALGYTRAAWRTEGQRAAAGIDQEGISMTMVITLKFDNLITARKATGHPDGTHTGRDKIIKFEGNYHGH